MRRPYTASRYRDLVTSLADRIPGLGLGADVMVGFPGESEEAFGNTCALVEETPLSFLHVFPYSPRGKTPAAKMTGRVGPAVKKGRGAALRALGARKRRAFEDRFLGQRLEVLFEGRREDGTGFLQGVTDNYIRVFAPGPDAAMDRILPVRLLAREDGRVTGRIEAR